MIRAVLLFTCLLSSLSLWAAEEKRPSYPSYDYDVARTHEIKPHRRTIPLQGVRSGFNQIRLTLTVSPIGEVLDADPGRDRDILKFWPQLQGEVRAWKFTPFEENGKAVTASVEEYIDLVPPERFPTKHVVPPVIRPDSSIMISLERTGCFGICPAYTVTISPEGIVFDGRDWVVASGKHTDQVDADHVRNLARSFVAADFYSMDAEYRAHVTDSPTYELSIGIDGRTKRVADYVGSWAGMPAVITELEEEVDSFARTERWVEGSEGLVKALQAEKFNFQNYDAQVVLKEAATRGKTATVREFLKAGVQLEPLPASKPREPYMAVPSENVGWLNTASRYLDCLKVLIDAGASKSDQADKDLALINAASSGSVMAARLLIDYGANPNVDLETVIIKESGGTNRTAKGFGSVLISAAKSKNPEMVREILHFHPNLEARDDRGRTAIFAAEDYFSGAKHGTRLECLRLLAHAGANVNARDNHGNTPLHTAYLADVVEELLRLGADVNARNNEGETPMFTVDEADPLALLIEHGADLAIRNHKGQTVMEADKEKGPARVRYLREAIEKAQQHVQP